MKTTNFIYYLLVLALHSCIPYKSYQNTDTICEVGMKLEEYEKTFDRKLSIKEGEWQNIDSGSFVLYYTKYTNEEGFFLTKWRKIDSVEKSIKYNKMGLIEYVFYRYNRVNTGTSYFFDTLGNITKVIDDRQADKYPICFREALEIVKRKTSKKYTISTIERDSMMIEDKKVYNWLVSTRDPKKYYWYYYYINAKTGKVIKKVRVQQGYD